jgi:hypothetical protein
MHKGPERIHPWEFEQGALPLQARPLPEIVPYLVEIQPIGEKIETSPPHNAIHNGFVPPVHFTPRIIVQPRPQGGNRRGKRS